MWRSEDNMWGLVFSFYQGFELSSFGLATGALTHRTISQHPPAEQCQFYNYFVMDIHQVFNINIWKIYRFVKYRENPFVIT